MRIIPISHHSTQRPKCQNNICRVAEKNLTPAPQAPQAPQAPPAPLLQKLPPQSTSRENVPENNDDCPSSDCHKCKCKCNHESEKRVVVIQNNNTTTTNQEEIVQRRRGGDYGGGYCYPSACYLDPCSSLGYVSPIRGPCWNLPPPPLPIFQPGFSGYGYGGGYGNFCPVRPPF